MLTLQDLIVPIPEYLSTLFKANKNNTYSYLDKYKVFKKIVEYNLRERGLLPNSSKEFCKITRHLWDRRDNNFKKFIERYTKKVNFCRRKSLPLNVKSFEPKNMEDSRKVTSTDIASVNTTIQVSNFFNGFPSTSDERIVFTRDFDMIGGNKDMVSNVIQFTIGEQAINNQSFDMVEGNINTVNEEEKVKSLFEEFIDKNAYE
ncbi:34307_t:CDS:1 [Racocetra persica]|uniref:34307_t:CDS:1 n=1 Tax=Racocetra persica TaxID=160502 RepID=A0ACA9RSQ4_9GLOM|nr:34307_t:CDS:1 [Racocetra persica]